MTSAGFTHSAFTFGYESFVHKSDINSNDVPPGALVSFVQKGLQYLEMEANLANEVRRWPGNVVAPAWQCRAATACICFLQPAQHSSCHSCQPALPRRRLRAPTRTQTTQRSLPGSC